jgi:hypothetical protein
MELGRGESSQGRRVDGLLIVALNAPSSSQLVSRCPSSQSPQLREALAAGCKLSPAHIELAPLLDEYVLLKDKGY